MMRHERLVLVGIIVAAAAGGGRAAAPVGDAAEVRVRVTAHAVLPERELEGARTEAQRLLGAAGVRLALETEGLDASPGIEVRLARCGQPGVPPCRPGVLGSTVKDGDGSRVRYIALYVDRIRAAARDTLAARSILLGRVLAHELVHALAGGGAHEDHGLMRCRWTLGDVDGPLDARRAFSPELRARVRLAAARLD